MVIDNVSRQRLLQKQTTDRLVKAIYESTPVPVPLDTTPFEELVTLSHSQRNLSKISLNILEKIQSALSDTFNKVLSKEDIKTDLQEIKQSIQEIKIPELPEIMNVQSQELLQAVKDIKIPEFPKIEFPKIDIPQPLPFPTMMDIGSIESLPPVVISNLKELSTLISNLQITTLQAMQSLKMKFPTSFKISDEVKVSEFGDLLEGIEEIKKGFNLLLKATQESRGTSSGAPMKVEIIKDLPRPMATPVTNISLNSLKGVPLSSQINVLTVPTLLPGNNLANRRTLIIYNNSNNTVYTGGAGVTIASGFPIPASTYSPPIDAGQYMNFYGIASQSSEVRVLEVSDIATGR